MADGEVVEVGTPAGLFDNPQEERTKKFLSQILQGAGAPEGSRPRLRALYVTRGMHEHLAHNWILSAEPFLRLAY